MMYQSKVPHQLWVEALFTAVYLGNLLPSSALDQFKSPYESTFMKPQSDEEPDQEPDQPVIEDIPPLVSPAVPLTAVVEPQQNLLNNADFPPLSSPAQSQTSSTDSSSMAHVPTHSMMTRGKHGFRKPNPRYVLFTVKTNYPTPKSTDAALKDERWNKSMKHEMNNFEVTHTWELVPPDPSVTPLSCHWTEVLLSIMAQQKTQDSKMGLEQKDKQSILKPVANDKAAQRSCRNTVNTAQHIQLFNRFDSLVC
ncbi:hypothetical protein YC2023_084183 [Brassica napus]